MRCIIKRVQKSVIFIIFLFFSTAFILSFNQIQKNSSFWTNDFKDLLGFKDFTGEEGNPNQEYRMIVLFQNNYDVLQFISQNSFDVAILKRFFLIPALLIYATPTEAAEISKLEGVTNIWFDQRVNYLPDSQMELIKDPTDSATILRSNDIDFNLTTIHEKYNGSNVIVAVLDTGIDPTHPDLDDHDDNETTNDSKIIGGVSFVEMEPFYLGDLHGHGTFVAGVIAGTGNASGGTVKGVAPGAMLMNVKVLASTGDGYSSWIISGIEYAVTHGADIIAMCFSGPGYPNDPVSQAIEAAVRQGVLVIAATGDDGPSYSSIGSPGMAHYALTVGNYDQFQGIVAPNSSRGPILDLRTGPDLIAPGVNITSCRINKTEEPLPYGIPDFGTPINRSYTGASGSFASAAYVAGTCALFLQAFKFLDPLTLKLALQKNAHDLMVNPNKQGLGVIDVNSTFSYLNTTYGEDPLVSGRLYTPSLPHVGFIGIDNKTFLNRETAVNCSIGSYGDFGILTYYNETSDFNTSHFLLGRFGVKYDNQDLKWFSDMRVLREMHQVMRGLYDRSLSILTDDSLLYTILIESWEIFNSTGGMTSLRNLTGFKISIIINNLLNTTISNISIYNWWKMDLFYNETNYAIDDVGVYNDTDDIIYVNDTYESTNVAAYIGFKATTPTSACEVGSNLTTYNNVVADNLSLPNFQSWSGGDVALASKWNIGNLNPGQNKNFSGALGLGDTYFDLKNQVEWTLYNTTSFNITDLAICDFNKSTGRMVENGSSIYTDVLLINVGTLGINNITTEFTLNSSSYDYSLMYTNLSLQPNQLQLYNALSTPVTTGIYNFSWYSINTTQEDLPQNYTLAEVLKRDNQPLDNVLSRNLFIYEKKSIDLDNGTLIFPSNLVFDPFLVEMPGDFIKYNVTIFSITNITDVSFQVDGNASDWITITPNSIENPGTYSFFGVELNIPIFAQPGSYNATLTVTLNSTFTRFIQINFNITNYTEIRGRVLFDASHGSIDALQDWEERLDSIYARYFDFYKLAVENFYNVDELPYGYTVTSDELSYYDAVIICDPERGYNSTEIAAYQSYVRDGGSLLILAENEEECNISSLNSILEDHQINITTTYTDGVVYDNVTLLTHNITENIEGIDLHNVVNITASGAATLLSDHIALINSSDDTNSKILVVGDSDLFINSNLNSQNNSQFALNCFNWLMSDTVKMQVDVYSNYSSGNIYLGEKVHISINILVPNGSTPVNSKALLAAEIAFPNGSLYYNYYSFYLRDGWHSMVFFTSIANQSGWYSITIFVKHVAGVSFYNTSIPAFYVNASQAPGTPSEEIHPPPGASLPPIVGFLSIWGLLLFIGIIGILDALKLKKKIKTI